MRYSLFTPWRLILLSILTSLLPGNTVQPQASKEKQGTVASKKAFD